jgi:NDP-mannose synthase
VGTGAGLVVAGGSGERMRRSGGGRAKPLVPVNGVPLLEYALAALLAADIDRLAVATATAQPEVSRFVDEHCRPLVEACGGSLQLIEETTPLGSIGAAGIVGDWADEVVVVNADNLGALDLGAMSALHRREGAAMTIAVHEEPFTMPFGQVTTSGARVLAYAEKPTTTFTVCSAYSVLGRAALARLRPTRFAMLPGLVGELLGEGAPVVAYHHDAPWVDVNDLTARARAEDLVGRRPDLFPTLRTGSRSTGR